MHIYILNVSPTFLNIPVSRLPRVSHHNLSTCLDLRLDPRHISDAMVKHHLLTGDIPDPVTWYLEYFFHSGENCFLEGHKVRFEAYSSDHW